MFAAAEVIFGDKNNNKTFKKVAPRALLKGIGDAFNKFDAYQLKKYSGVDYNNIKLSEVPKFIKEAFEITKNMFNLEASEKIILIKDALKIIIDETDATGSFESTTVIMIPKIVDSIIRVNENGSIELVDRKKPGKFTQKLLLLALTAFILLFTRSYNAIHF